MNKSDRIFVAGHTGLVGSAIVRQLKQKGYDHLLLKTHQELDLTDQASVNAFFNSERPDFVFVAAGLVGGIKANSASPADFFTINMEIATNILLAAKNSHVKKLLYLGSACMYPKACTQPMKEEFLLTGVPEITNEGYALAKICGSRLCSYMRKQYGVDFISAIPANAYGPGDHFDLEKSHVIPALIVKYHQAQQQGLKSISLWGTGSALREFIHTDDLADACIFLMQNYSSADPINIGVGSEVSILGLAEMIKDVVGFQGDIICDPSKPDGMMRRMVDASKLNSLGWKSTITLRQGLEALYGEYLNQIEKE